MDISDILHSVSDPFPPVHSVDLQALTRAWVNERVAPEVLPYPAELMVRVMQGIARLVSSFHVVWNEDWAGEVEKGGEGKEGGRQRPERPWTES